MSKNIMNRLFVFIIIVILSSCGGGTTGTGTLSERSFSGTLNDTKGSPLASFNITILESGDSAKTDENGNFLIDTSLEEDKATFLVEGSSLNNEVEVSNLPQDQGVVNLELEGDTENNTIVLLSVEITPLVGVDPTPTPTATLDDNTREDNVQEREPEPIDTPALNNIYKGTVSDQNGNKLSGVKVSLINFGKSKSTNGSGNFEFSSKPGKANVKLSVEFNGALRTFSIKVPKKSVKVVLKIRITIEEGEIGTLLVDPDGIELNSVNIKER